MADWQIVKRDVHDQLGEGACWSPRDQAFYWVDILAPALNRLSLDNGEITRWTMPAPLGWVVRCSTGGLIGGFQSGVAEIHFDPLVIRPIVDPEPHLPGNRMNDGKADASGRIWFGTMDMAEQADSGSLYRLDADRQWSRLDEGYRVPNGPAFSRDGQWLYHSDTARRTIYRFTLHEDGSITNRQPFIAFTEADGYPDGMTVDAAGGLWVAHWGGSRISRFGPDGMLERSIALPARQITNMAFAGEGLDRLFVTSAATGLPPSEFDGALFEVDPGAIGLPTHEFAG